jgi:glycosyltransferase involved in cell wall biosynthesis
MIGVSREIEGALRAHPRLGTIPTYYLPYGVEVPANAAPRTLLPVETRESLRILYLGRLCQPQKRVRLFPEIAQRLQSSGVAFRWSIAGEGPERSWLEGHLPSSPGAEVAFLGSLNYEQVPAVLEAHDVFLLASDAEGLPLSLLEAMGRGLVPVVSDLPSGVSEVVDATTGILVNPAKVEDYAAGIAQLAADRELYALLSAEAVRRIAGQYSVAAMADRWLAVVQTAAQPGPIGSWPETPKINAPLGHDGFRFSAPMRALRRWLRALRAK